MFERSVSGASLIELEAPPGAVAGHGGRLLDRICCVDAVIGLRALPEACIPLTVTSPPYDGLRTFGGHEFGPEVFERIARGLWRVTMPGRATALHLT